MSEHTEKGKPEKPALPNAWEHIGWKHIGWKHIGWKPLAVYKSIPFYSI